MFRKREIFEDKVLLMIILIFFSSLFLLLQTNKNCSFFLNYFIMIANEIMAICAYQALKSWQYEIKTKRKFDLIDKLLDLIIQAEIFIDDLMFYSLDLKDTNNNKLNIPATNRRALKFKRKFELLSNKFKTINLLEFYSKTNTLSNYFKYSNPTKNGEYMDFYKLYKNDYSMRDEINTLLKELKSMCKEQNK